MRKTTMNVAGAGPLHHLWFPIAIIVFALMAYHNSFAGVFVFDDRNTIIGNAAVHDWPPKAIFFLTRPLFYLTLAVNYQLGGFNPVGYHVINLLIHVLAALTLFGLLRRTFVSQRFHKRVRTSAGILAACISILWVVHPLQTESVTYISQRSELLAGLFYLWTLYCFVRSHDSPVSGRWKVGAVLACAFGMATKEVMITAPLAVLLYDRIFLSTSWRELFARGKGFYASLFGTYAILWLTMLGADLAQMSESAGFSYKGITSLRYAMNQSSVILHYLKLAIWPTGLCLDYVWRPAASSGTLLGPSAILIALMVVMAVTLKRSPGIGFFGLWFFVTIAPSSSFFPIRDLAFEHRMYLPLIAVIALIVLWLYAAMDTLLGAGRRRRQAARAVACLALGSAMVLSDWTVRRNQDYHGEVHMWQDVIRKRPDNPRAHYNLGRIYSDQGKLKEAAASYERATMWVGDYADAHNNLGATLASIGELEKGIEEVRKAIRLNPNLAKAHNNLGTLLRRQGKLEEARSHYGKAIQIDPNYAIAKTNLKSLGEEMRGGSEQ
jgi:protein O-mannosyl-transferase